MMEKRKKIMLDEAGNKYYEQRTLLVMSIGYFFLGFILGYFVFSGGL